MKKKTLVLIITYAMIVFFLFPLQSKAEGGVYHFMLGLQRSFYEFMQEKGFKQYPTGFERFGGMWDPLDFYNKDKEFRAKSDMEYEANKRRISNWSTLPRDQFEREKRQYQEFFDTYFPGLKKDPPVGDPTLPVGFKWKIFVEDTPVHFTYKNVNFKFYSEKKYKTIDGVVNVVDFLISYDLEGVKRAFYYSTTPYPRSSDNPFYTYYYDFKKDSENHLRFFYIRFNKKTNKYESFGNILLMYNSDYDDNADDPEFDFLQDPGPGYVWQPDWSKLPGVKKHMGPDGKIWYSVDENTMLEHAKDLPLIRVPDGEGYDVYYDRNPGQFFLVPQGSDFPPLRDDGFTLKPPPDFINNPPGEGGQPGQPQDPGQGGQPQDPNQPPPVDPEQPENLRPPTPQDIQKQQNDALQAIKDIEFNPEIKKRDWKGKFPFSLPFDVARIFKSMAVRPKPIVYKIDFSAFGVRINHTVDFKPFEKLIKLVRFFFLLSFTMTLIGWTRKIAKW